MFRLKLHAATFALVIGLLTTFNQTARSFFNFIKLIFQRGESFRLSKIGSSIHSFSQIIRRAAASLAVALFICCAVAYTAQAQSVITYNMAPSSGTFTPLSGATVQTVTRGDRNNGTYPLAPIGFNFRYSNVTYTQVSASTNGWMRFGTQSNNSAPTNDLTGLVVITGDMPRPSVAPLWDDLEVNSTNGSVSYRTTGTAPNRVFTMQWLNMEWGNSANTPGISFQVKLYEETDVVQFVYRQEAGILAIPSASIGLAATNFYDFISLSDSGTNPTISRNFGTETTTISTKPATGQTYTFTPQRADLAVTITDSPDPLATTPNLTYTINRRCCMNQ